jgi:hypothetical protein
MHEVYGDAVTSPFGIGGRPRGRRSLVRSSDVATYRPYAYRTAGQPRRATPDGPPEEAALVGAVRDDIRQTLRMAWIDPAFEVGAGHPAFLTAAWSAIRPNIGKSFLNLARSLRADAAASVRSEPERPDLLRRLQDELSEEELRRVEDSARAAYLAVPKLQIVVHALHRIVRRERIPGTGREESPVRRGVPEWQRWMGFQPASEESASILEEASAVLGAPTPPAAISLFARWPAAVAALWDEMAPRCPSESWRTAVGRLRRLVLAGVASLPHPMELQWSALKARGFDEEGRLALLEVIATHDAAMASQTLVAAFSWVAVGAPEVSEG